MIGQIQRGSFCGCAMVVNNQFILSHQKGNSNHDLTRIPLISSFTHQPCKKSKEIQKFMQKAK